jgi:hypothetical protein
MVSSLKSLARRLTLVLGLIFFIVFPVVYGGVWWLTARVIELGVERGLQVASAIPSAGSTKAWQVGNPAWEIEGFPFAWRWNLEQTGLAYDAAGWHWQAQGMRAEIVPWKPGEVRLTLDKEQKVNGFFEAGFPFIARLAGGSGHLRWRLPGEVTEGDFDLTDLVLAVFPPGMIPVSAEDPAATSVRLARAALSVLQPAQPPVQGSDPALLLEARIERFQLPEELILVRLGTTLQEALLKARLSGSVPWPVAKELEAWRVAGGQAVIDEFSLSWGPLNTRLFGTLTLDHNLQPQGILTLEIQGGEAVVESLREARLIERTQAEALKALLKTVTLATAPILAIPTLTAPSVAPAPVAPAPWSRIPLSLSEGKLRLGPFVVARLPTLVWS